MPTRLDSYETFLYTAGTKIPYKSCPETDSEEVANVGEPAVSIAEKAKLDKEALWAERVKTCRMWYDENVGNKVWKWSADNQQSGYGSWSQVAEVDSSAVVVGGPKCPWMVDLLPELLGWAEVAVRLPCWCPLLGVHLCCGGRAAAVVEWPAKEGADLPRALFLSRDAQFG